MIVISPSKARDGGPVEGWVENDPKIFRELP